MSNYIDICSVLLISFVSFIVIRPTYSILTSLTVFVIRPTSEMQVYYYSYTIAGYRYMQVEYCQATNAMSYKLVIVWACFAQNKNYLGWRLYCSAMYRPTCFVNCSRRITAALPIKLEFSNLFSLFIADFKLFLFHLAAQVLNSWVVNVSRSILIPRYVLQVRKSCRTSKR